MDTTDTGTIDNGNGKNDGLYKKKQAQMWVHLRHRIDRNPQAGQKKKEALSFSAYLNPVTGSGEEPDRFFPQKLLEHYVKPSKV